MSISTLFKSNVTVNAHTSEDFLKLTKKCVERVQKMSSKGIMFTPPKFNYHQCKYLADKLKLVVESAQTLPPKDITKCFEIIKLVHGFANVVENFIQSCRQDRWIQAAMTMTNLSVHVSSLGFYMEAISQSFLGVLTSTSVDGIYQSEIKIVEEKASYDRESLFRNLNALLQTKPTTWKVHQLATLLLERLQHPQRHKNGSTPRFFQNDEYNLKQMEQLGKGSFATVFKATWLGIEVAKKTFYARDSPDFEKEVSILQTLSHPNITSLFGCAKDDHECSMIMELMDDDLFSLIHRRMKENKKRGYPFDIIEAMDMMLQIGGGMKYLHEMRIVHRDLKSMNILVKYVKTRDTKIAYVLAKVSDFGLSRIKQQSLTQSNQTPNMGTARWMAPEMIKLHLAESSIWNADANDAKVAKHPFKSDVYSFAMVCYEILSGEMPYFEEHNLNEVKKKVLKGDRPQLPSHCPPDLKSLVEKCWNADASKRPCFTEIFTELRQFQCSLLMPRMTFYEKRIPVVNNFQARKFTIDELTRITNNFSASHIMGGGFQGTFYKGVFSDGILLAVWRASQYFYSHYFRRIQAEIHSFSIQGTHPNLLRGVGSCVTPSDCFLVYPYMSNGTVHSQLRKVDHGKPALSFKMRKHIALGVAKALAYLHEECISKIVHQNVNSGAILLDNEYEALVGCFQIQEHGVSVHRQGIIGCIVPEYKDCGTVSVKNDVYSYGVLLLELITARDQQWFVQDDRGNERAVDLVCWVQKFPILYSLELIVDSNLKEYDTMDMTYLLQVALSCTQSCPSDRPKMSEVVNMLRGTTLTPHPWRGRSGNNLNPSPPEGTKSVLS